jgi:dihydroorotase
MLSKCKWTPFDGMKVTGMPIMTIVNGNIVYDNGKTADLPAQEVSYF